MKNRTLRGFTLIETLLVLAIVSALAALLFGVMGPARESGRRSSCLSNMHQWGTAFSMYMSDWDGQVPALGQQLTHEQLGLPENGQAILFAKTYHLVDSPVANCPSTHYPPNTTLKVPSMTSYHITCIYPESIFPDLPQKIASLGPAFPLMVCDMHNANTDWLHQPTWARKNVQILQIDQQVVYKNVPASAGDL